MEILKVSFLASETVGGSSTGNVSAYWPGGKGLIMVQYSIDPGASGSIQWTSIYQTGYPVFQGSLFLTGTTGNPVSYDFDLPEGMLVVVLDSPPGLPSQSSLSANILKIS